MLFTAVLIILLVIFSIINGCPSQRPCTTATGTRGSCIQARECRYIYRLNGSNLTPEELNFLRKSVCGIDLDNTRLFCCDNDELRRSGGHVVNRQDEEIKTQPAIAVEEIHDNGPYTSAPYTSAPYTSTPYKSTTYTTTTYTSTAAAATPTTTTVQPPQPEAPMPCQTPNGEKALCISIYQCVILRNNILSHNTTENQIRFLKESACGYDKTEKPLVCCGSDTNFARINNGEIRSNYNSNPLIPYDLCGIQRRDLEEQQPQTKQRRLPSTNTMNFTLPNRIFGGMNSELSEFPWIALLAYETYNGQKTFGCGGSLISSRYVLTAAHCVSAKSLENFTNKLTSIRLGEWDYGNDGKDCITTEGLTRCNEAEINVGIESIHLHPGYRVKSNERYHDIALIRLNREVTFTNYIRPICLPNIDDYVAPGDRLTVSGWGLVDYNQETTIKQKVEVPAVARSRCSVMFEKSPGLSQLGRGQFCAGGESGKDACVGDSGAPIMKKLKSGNLESSLWSIEGIVSFGKGCGLVNQYGVYTKVSEYLGWIHSTIVQ